MSEENRNRPPRHNRRDVPPSTLFLEMMRQAAREAQESQASAPAPAPIPEPEPEPLLIEPDFLSQQVDHPFQAIPPLTPVADPFSEPKAEPILPTKAIATETPPTIPTTSTQANTVIYPAPPEEVDPYAEQMEEQRIQRVKRRQERRNRRNMGIFGGFFGTVIITFLAGALAATIFTWFTAPDFITSDVVTGLQVADSTSVAVIVGATPTPIDVTPNWLRRIGIVSGHRGPENDPGAVCDDGFTEASVNFGVAQLVVRALREQGYSVDLLDEFDPRLENYQAAALVSIHSNDCSDYGEFVSGYLVARAAARAAGGLDDVLAECIAKYYAPASQLERRFSLTIDMTDYHTFREIHPQTPAAIIELGFLRGDRQLLEFGQERMAEGILSGILCLLNGENPLHHATPDPALLIPTSTPETGSNG